MSDIAAAKATRDVIFDKAYLNKGLMGEVC